jgi:ABC-type transport system substrate-binding protein
VNGYAVCRRILDLADPLSVDYSPAWASLIEGAVVQDVLQVDVDLRRAHVLPEALLRVPFEPTEVASDGLPIGNGAFSLSKRTEKYVHYLEKGFSPGGRLAEVVERTYGQSNQALAALRRSEIDILDRLFPADALRLREDPALDGPIHVEQYALPTVHMLVPNPKKNPYLAHRDFRRALVFAIDREKILNQVLLGGREVWGCRVVSGPFAAGAGDSDPLGYAYDGTIQPRRYDPRLAKLLTVVAQKQVTERANMLGESAPKLSSLVIGHPSYEAARVACEAIAGQYRIIGLECTLQEFAPGVSRDPEGNCDLVYTEIAIWEPVVDARRLLGPGGAAASDSPYVRQTLRWLDTAQNWGEVRERLLQIHSAVHNEVAIIPLWQMVDFFAYNKRLRNVGENLVWLYQHVDEWRIGAAAAE